MTRLSPHFTLQELTFSQTAVRFHINNIPPAEVVEALKRTAEYLERVRSLLRDAPIQISSGYRGARLNFVLGGSPHSAHMHGHAVDFIAPQFGTPREICEAIRDSAIGFDQLIHEGTWVHLSFDPRMRREVLTAYFAPGRVTYIEGLTG